VLQDVERKALNCPRDLNGHVVDSGWSGREEVRRRVLSNGKQCFELVRAVGERRGREGGREEGRGGMSRARPVVAPVGIRTRQEEEEGGGLKKVKGTMYGCSDWLQ
jgi:hypothetical protein